VSLNVLVIPEDFRKDQYILAPIVRRIFAEIGKPQARVEICMDPLLEGVSQAMDWDNIDEVIDMYPMVQIFLLLVDRDGKAGRRAGLDRLQELAVAKLRQGRVLYGENAWQEVEVWALAGQTLPTRWKWVDVRAEVHPKETYFEPLSRDRELTDEPGEGRTTMGREAAQNYARVRSRCNEIQDLEFTLRKWIEAN
jgi:hypothetical protein